MSPFLTELLTVGKVSVLAKINSLKLRRHSRRLAPHQANSVREGATKNYGISMKWGAVSESFKPCLFPDTLPEPGPSTELTFKTVLRFLIYKSQPLRTRGDLTP